MSAIRFFYEDTPFRVKKVNSIKAWIKKVISLEQRELSGLNYIFCSDTYLLDINIKYLSHKSLTDIITFDLTPSEDSKQHSNKIEGEIYISVDRVKENAVKFDTQFSNELHRVIIHGVLHLAGYSDKNPRNQTLMRKKEDAYLSLRGF